MLGEPPCIHLIYIYSFVYNYSRRDRVQTEPNCVKYYKNMYSMRLYVLLYLPLAQRAIITALAVFTVYEWKNGRKP